MGRDTVHIVFIKVGVHVIGDAQVGEIAACQAQRSFPFGGIGGRGEQVCAVDGTLVGKVGSGDPFIVQPHFFGRISREQAIFCRFLYPGWFFRRHILLDNRLFHGNLNRGSLPWLLRGDSCGRDSDLGSGRYYGTITKQLQLLRGK